MNWKAERMTTHPRFDGANIPQWAIEAAASAHRISAADAGPLIAIFAAARRRIAEAELAAQTQGEPE